MDGMDGITTKRNKIFHIKMIFFCEMKKSEFLMVGRIENQTIKCL